MRSRALSSNQQTSSFSSTPSNMNSSNNNSQNVVTIPRSQMPSRKIKSIYEIVNDTYGASQNSSQPLSTSSTGSVNSRNKNQPNRVTLNSTVNCDSFSYESQRPQYSDSFSNRSNQAMHDNYFSEQTKSTMGNQQGLQQNKQNQFSTPNSTMSSSSSFEAAFISSNIALKKPPTIYQKRTALTSSENDTKENSFISSNFPRDPVQLPAKTPLFKLSTQTLQSFVLDKQEEKSMTNFPIYDLKEPVESFILSQENKQSSSSHNCQELKGIQQQLFNNTGQSRSQEFVESKFQCEIPELQDGSFSKNSYLSQQVNQYRRSSSSDDSFNQQENYSSNGGVTPLFAGDQEEIESNQVHLSNEMAMLHQFNKSNRLGQFDYSQEASNEVIRRMRETIHSLQSKDASYRLEISKLKKHNLQLKQIISDNNAKQVPILDQMRKDGEYIRQLDDQLTVYKQKITTIQKTLIDQGKLQERIVEQEKKGVELEEENMQLRITIESILMIQQEQIDKIELQQQNASNLVRSDEDQAISQENFNADEQYNESTQENNLNIPTNYDYFYLPNEEDIIREQAEEDDRSEKSIDDRMYMSNHGMIVEREMNGNDLSSPYQQLSNTNADSYRQLSTKKVTVNLQTLLQASRGEVNRERNIQMILSKSQAQKQEQINQERIQLDQLYISSNQNGMVFKKKQFINEDQEDDVNYDDNLEVKRDEAIQLFEQARALLLR